VRLFVAVWPSPEAIEHLTPVVAALANDPPAGNLARILVGDPSAGGDGRGLRWTAPPQWHLTLAFLGESGPEVLPELQRRLGRAAARARELTLAFAGGGRFGDRVLYTKVSGEREQLRHLAASVGAAARRTGIRMEDRAYRPHLTLARGRPGCDLRPLVTALADYRGPEWRSETLELVRSHLGAGPGHTSRYEVVRSWPLAGRTSGPN
jgi:2'-5' RNA ligase